MAKEVWVIYHDEDWEIGAPIAIFSTPELAKKWIDEHDCNAMHGIKKLSVDNPPEDCLWWCECDENEDCEHEIRQYVS